MNKQLYFINDAEAYDAKLFNGDLISKEDVLDLMKNRTLYNYMGGFFAKALVLNGIKARGSKTVVKDKKVIFLNPPFRLIGEDYMFILVRYGIYMDSYEPHSIEPLDYFSFRILNK